MAWSTRFCVAVLPLTQVNCHARVAPLCMLLPPNANFRGHGLASDA